ncbi:MAG: phosphoribosylformylglycinamidine synthase [Selenomonadaceae bacterium]|nr:phosphoribosylformylglycinamidine synthase [Selenomonadaceae bacterium]
MSVRRVFIEKRKGFDVPAAHLFEDICETLEIKELQSLRLFQRYDIEGLSDEEYNAVKDIVFSEPPVDVRYEETLPVIDDAKVFAIEYLPGQYDQRADSAAQCIQLITGKERPTIQTAEVIALIGDVKAEDVERVKKYLINAVESREASMDKPATLQMMTDVPPNVEILSDFNYLDDAALENFLKERGFAMAYADLKFCQSYFRDTEKRPPTITELKVIDTYWSDHCRHTTFMTKIDDIIFEAIDDDDPAFFIPAIMNSHKQYLSDRRKLYGEQSGRDVSLMDLATIGTKSLRYDGMLPNLDVSDEVNACSFNVKAEVDGKLEDWLIMFKNETHNHPTEIEPFGGAATCLGGAIRDPLSGRTYVYQAMRVTGAADPRRPLAETLSGKLPQKKITQGAAQGYSSYGNQIGLATGQVHEVYHEGYLAKRMEIGAVVAAAPKANVKRESPAAGDVIVLLGGRTGRDGIGGATGSSKAHDSHSVENCGAEVQKGNPPTERKIQRLFRNPQASKLIKRCNDFGAGGVAVAIGELANGLEISLDAVPKKYEGLDGTELAISESQERMAVVLSPADVEAFEKLADAENLETAKVAVVTEAERLVMKWRDQRVVDISRAFLDTNGVKQHITANVHSPKRFMPLIESNDLKREWLNNLKDLNICSQKGLAERFDSTIGAATVLMPFGGKNQLTPAEGMVAKLPVEGKTNTATAMTFGFDPYISEWSPFHGAIDAVTASLTKLVALGADFRTAWLSLQEYFERLGNNPDKWGKPVSALLGAFLAQKGFGVAAIGGKDSMSGTFENLNVPPTLVSFAIAPVEANKVISSEFKEPNHKVWLIPCPRDRYGVPIFNELKANFLDVYKLISEGKIISAMSVDRGGIAATISKMAIGNDIGFKFNAAKRSVESFFTWRCGTLIVETANDVDLGNFEHFVELGMTIDRSEIICGDMTISLEEIKSSYTAPLEKIFPTRINTKKSSNIEDIKYQQPNHSTIAAHSRFKLKPKIFIPVFPGTNCEYDSAKAWREAGGEPEVLVIRNLTPASVEESIEAIVRKINESQIIMFPGGFSGGDEPDGSGKFIAAMFRNPKIAESVMELLNKRDGLILGICNGFQALIKLGLLPYGEIRPLKEDDPTLTHNTLGRHVSCMVNTRIVSNSSPWLNDFKVGDIHTIAVSHGEGRFVANDDWIAKLAANGQIATQYVDVNNQPTMDLPFNPNGSIAAIEGITSADGRIFGKMGHSERRGVNVFKNITGNTNQPIFESGVKYYV